MKTAGVVLCGGKSSRYGTQKIFETFQGQHLYERSLHSFLSADLTAYLLTNRILSSQFREPAARILVEKEEYQGPLYGLYSSIEMLPAFESIFMLPADVPWVHTGFVRHMLGHASRRIPDYNALIPVSGGRIHPVHGIYHRSVYAQAECVLQEGERSMLPLLEQIRPFYLSFSDTEPVFININRKTDWNPSQE
ncbi:molybdenum cofactor guanylyltransferase [Salibacterium qingdaonense]|uniref:Probable molybdenum cofactor guanylyltransferase n=1 Tax=Salibacterium qingdaonense TaxID=266892 RepID=A0A1I4K394_9BACI|nr:molybdenum cofactor guanylyltransferase [Salibacterium qingdaonense]SFL73091.1 molybdopterin-guanine dinucleotide biosynthesis protein A [Salibacterium qingdaonense]